MRGLIDNAGEFSTKQRVLPNVDTQLTHPDDIVEELESWVKTYAYIQNLSDIAQARLKKIRQWCWIDFCMF
jgi:hypothetical protein